MNGLWYLIPISIGLGLLGLGAFLWALSSGQYDGINGIWTIDGKSMFSHAQSLALDALRSEPADVRAGVVVCDGQPRDLVTPTLLVVRGGRKDYRLVRATGPAK